MIDLGCQLCEWKSEVAVEGTIEKKMDFVFDRLIVADFTQSVFNRFIGFAVASTFDEEFMIRQSKLC